MNSFTLKIIASIAMLLDHIGVIFVPMNTQLYTGLRIIGRIAFPIYCFLLVQGFFHTKDIKKYLLRLFLFAVISEVAFDFAFHKRGTYLQSQNVFFTLFLGLLVIYVYHYVIMNYREQPIMMNTLAVITILVGSVATFLLRTDYSYIGIIFIVCIYIYQYSKVKLAISLILMIGVLCSGLQLYSALAIPFIMLYNGKRGPKVKYAFYAFYPVHLFILGLVAYFI